jgi:DNA-binding transcriptional LysR family regulator
VHLEVRIGLSRSLMKALDAGELDAVIGRVEEGERQEAVWREPLHWAAARGLALERGQPVPLAVLPPPCSFREQAMALLDRKKRPWRIALTGSGMAGIQAAVSAGVGVSLLPASMLLPSMRILERADGFPDAGEHRLGFYQRRAAPTPLVAAFREILGETLDLMGAARRSA